MTDSPRASADDAPRFDYEFSVWPVAGSEPALFEIHRNTHRMVLTYTATEWAGFRSSAERAGLTLREITRVPYQEPEIVI